MKKKYIFIILIISTVACKLHKTLYKSAVTDGIVLLSFEKAGIEDRYFLKSQKIIINNKYYDLIDWIPPRSELDLLLKNRGIKEHLITNKCAFFGEGDIYYSNYLYYWLNDESDLSIIFSVKGSVIIINKLPSDMKYGNYNHYSCPIVIDTLSIPYCKLIDIDSCYATNPDWTTVNLFFRTEKKNFKVAFCD